MRFSSVPADLGSLQQSLGVQYLKYATALPPVPRAPVNYDNPLYAGTVIDKGAPWSWYIDYPLRGVATLGLHVFNMTDQDLLRRDGPTRPANEAFLRRVLDA